MGSFSIFHWLIVLIVIGGPIWLIVWLVWRGQRPKRLDAPGPKDPPRA